MFNIQERFKELKSYGYFIKADAKHILDWYIGLDDQGRKSIKFRAKFTPRNIMGTNTIIVNQYKSDDYNTLIFSLEDNEISGLFYRFCEDLMETSRSIDEPDLGYTNIINRFSLWKKMFLKSRNEFLTEPEIMGLIGEILFLEEQLFGLYGKHQALLSWSGQELTHKDFSNDDTWYEIKTMHRGSQTVKISSIEQLESDKIGELVVYSLEKMSPAFNGIKLNELVSEIYESFDNEDDKGDFFTKVSLQGFTYNDHYDDYVYEVSDCRKFLVDEEFPKLDRNNLISAIVKAQYELSLVNIMDYEIK
ncbi:PD-(D/E)XK motif protein [Clostridium sp. CF012]|uniref:PD-(D/E)XK motif protein n=1 Tax=Clostridium sp. CF012 TaxID=2843319 RepID=UPI001C0B7051|nr:PD-(D/E)XK motif protein [Clostridium sp. CF012]MBU3144629.1 PD-(D/E)XK motif protein [Clostridium sp. CF012]